MFTKLDLSEKFINWQLVSINSVWPLLHEDFCKNWEDNIKMMSKLRTYIKFKKVFEVEPYVLSFMGRKRRSYLAQLRTGTLPLQHFLFHCNFYYGECQEFYNYMKNNIPNFINRTKAANSYD